MRHLSGCLGGPTLRPGYSPDSSLLYGLIIFVGQAEFEQSNGSAIRVQDIPPFQRGFVNVTNDHGHIARATTAGGVEVRLVALGEPGHVPSRTVLMEYLCTALTRYTGK